MARRTGASRFGERRSYSFPALQTMSETGPNQGHCRELRKIIFLMTSPPTDCRALPETRTPLFSKSSKIGVPGGNLRVSFAPMPERR